VRRNSLLDPESDIKQRKRHVGLHDPRVILAAIGHIRIVILPRRPATVTKIEWRNVGYRTDCRHPRRQSGRSRTGSSV
jgi:hypothetical protein